MKGATQTWERPLHVKGPIFCDPVTYIQPMLVGCNKRWSECLKVGLLAICGCPQRGRAQAAWAWKRSVRLLRHTSMAVTGRPCGRSSRLRAASGTTVLHLSRPFGCAGQQKATLVIAKLDRLARNVHFISGLMESGVEFVAVDMPSANRFVVHILAAVAEQEAEVISKRIKAALAAAKERGTVLGGRRVSAKRFAEIGAAARQTFRVQAAKGRAQVLLVIAEIQGQGISTLRGIAAELNVREIDAPRGGPWSAVQVQRVIRRIE